MELQDLKKTGNREEKMYAWREWGVRVNLFHVYCSQKKIDIYLWLYILLEQSENNYSD